MSIYTCVSDSCLMNKHASTAVQHRHKYNIYIRGFHLLNGCSTMTVSMRHDTWLAIICVSYRDVCKANNTIHGNATRGA